MKKLTLYLLLLSMLLSLVACGGGGDGAETTTDTESESVTTPAEPEPDPFAGGTEVESIIAVDWFGNKHEITPHTTGLMDMFQDYDQRSVQKYGCYILKNEEGRMAVLDFENDKLYLYPKREAPTRAELDQITEGMLALDVILMLEYMPEFPFLSSSIGGGIKYTSADGVCTYELVPGCNDYWVEDLGNRYGEIFRIAITYHQYCEEPLLPAAKPLASEIAVGMNREALISLLPDGERIDWDCYILFRDRDGKSVIVTLDENDVVTDVTAYAHPATVPTKEEVAEFRGKDHTIFDYVEAFGLPYFDIEVFGNEMLYVMTTTGNSYIGKATNGQHHKIY